MAAELTILIPIIVGLLIGILEAFFVYEDENMTSGKDFLGDMWHGLIFSVIFVFVACNIPWVLGMEFVPEWVSGLLFVDEAGNSIVASIIITLFMMVKMVSSHAIKGVRGGGFKEKLWHKITVAVLVGFSPYYIDLARPIFESFLMGILPEGFPL